MNAVVFVWKNPIDGKWLLIIRRWHEEGLTIYQHPTEEAIAQSLIKDGVPEYGYEIGSCPKCKRPMS